MQDALVVFRDKSHKPVQMNAEAFERAFVTPEARSHVDLLGPKTATPLYFKPAQRTKGGAIVMSAHFARKAGYAKTAHVFDRAARQNFNEAVDSGQKVLLTLNQQLVYQNADFSEMEMRTGTNLIDYVGENHSNYVTSSLVSAQDAFKKINAVTARIPKEEVNSRISVLHRGGIIPFNQFFLGARKRDLKRLHHNLVAGRHGDLVGEERIVGFPRMFRAVAADTTRAQEAAFGVRCNQNPYWHDGHFRIGFSQLVFEDELYRASPAYGVLYDQLMRSREGVYVLASPSVTVPTEDEKAAARPKKWAQTRWLIRDIERQTYQSPAQAERLWPEVEAAELNA